MDMSIMELLYAQAEKRPDATALVYATQRLTFGELIDRIERLAHGFASSGVSPGDAVALVMRGDPWFVSSFHAITALGAVAVPVNPSFKQAEVESYFRDAGVRFVVGDERTADACHKLAAGLDPPALVEKSAPGRLPARDPDEDFVFQFSSGSTGRSKRMARTQGQIAAEAALYVSLGLTSADTIFSAVPLFHNWGLGSCLFAQAATGATVVILEDPHPFLLRRDRALELIEREKVTIFPGVPFNFRLMAEAPSDADLSSLRLCLSAGTGLPKATFEAFHERFGIPIRQLYGTTETGMVAANMSDDPASTLESVGRPAGDVEVEIIDEEGNPVPTGEEGEVTITSPAMTAGYAGADMAELNELAFRGGRYLTGDVGFIDAEGVLSLTGRKKLLIDVGGFKVDPIEVEDAIAQHPQVGEVVVVGVPGEVQGEEVVKAAVVLAGPLEARELTTYCRQRLANFKIPQVIEFREEIPKSPLGKILRKYLVSDSKES
ncbi:MAG: class I adenylate-forming enzyme family protein [Solirubrobacterales bacterium]